MEFFKTWIDATLADDDLKLLGYKALGVRHFLMCFISKSSVMNYLYDKYGQPRTDEDLAAMLHLGLQEWLQVKKRLLRYGGFSLDSKNAVGIPKWSEHQSDYYRQRGYRLGYKEGYTESDKKVTHRSKEVKKLRSKEDKSIKNEPAKDTAGTAFVTRLFKYWGEHFKDAVGYSYMFAFGKEGKIFKDILKCYEREKQGEELIRFVADLVDTYFEMSKENRWLKRRLTVGNFRSCIAEVLAVYAKKT